MGRKKRKSASASEPEAVPAPGPVPADPRSREVKAEPPSAPPDPRPRGDVAAARPAFQISAATMTRPPPGPSPSDAGDGAASNPADDYLGSAKPSSQYGLHSHAGDLVEDDVYVSDGSASSSDGEGDGEGGGDDAAVNTRPGLELLLTTSRMGLMRRGGLGNLVGQPQMNRTWVRGEDAGGGNTDGAEDGDGVKSEGHNEEDEADLDPAARLALQNRRIEAARAAARLLESSENAGRDPCLFSKRTSFDIRMDQIEDKPWDRPANPSNPGAGGGETTEYFNYGMDEHDWAEYAEGQLAIRQELTDAARQKRTPDPGIVPVVPRAPKQQGDRVAVVRRGDDDGGPGGEGEGDGGDVEMGAELGPLAARREAAADDDEGDANAETKEEDEEEIVGGAWGAGASKDSVLHRLIVEQVSAGFTFRLGQVFFTPLSLNPPCSVPLFCCRERRRAPWARRRA